MEQNNQKIITLSFVIAGFLTAIVADVLLETLAASWGTFARIYDSDAIRHGVPVVLAFTVFAVLQFNKRIQTWADEAVVEIRKVVWPTRRDTTAMTIVVCVMVLIAGVVLGVFDFLSRTIVTMIIN